jgi:hypothetical protein
MEVMEDHCALPMPRLIVCVMLSYHDESKAAIETYVEEIDRTVVDDDVNNVGEGVLVIEWRIWVDFFCLDFVCVLCQFGHHSNQSVKIVIPRHVISTSAPNQELKNEESRE